MEILIEHYRLGMKLSMPVIVGDKTLLDAGASIDNEKVLERVINNGVKKLDVHKSHIGELSKKYPEFYERHQEKVAEAKEAGRATRAQVAKDWARCRALVKRPPAITLLAKPMHLPDTSKWLSPFFQMEHASSSFREIKDSINRSKLIVIRLKEFGEEELDFIRAELKQEMPQIPVLAVVERFYSGPWDVVRWGGDGASLFRAAFLMIYPEHYGELSDKGVVGFHTDRLKRPSLHLITRGNSLEEAEVFFEKWPHLDVLLSQVDQAPADKHHVTVFRCPNKDQRLLEDMRILYNHGINVRDMLIFIDEVSKEEVTELSKMGKLKVHLGNLDHSALENVLLQLSPDPS